MGGGGGNGWVNNSQLTLLILRILKFNLFEILALKNVKKNTIKTNFAQSFCG